jgi:hypothetical protein
MRHTKTMQPVQSKCKATNKNSNGSGGIRTHASEETGALNQRLRPLGHATYIRRDKKYVWHNSGLDFSVCNFSFLDSFSGAAMNASIAQWQSVGLVNQRSWVQSSLEATRHFVIWVFKVVQAKKILLTPTWFEHAAFWSGVRRATVAPRSQSYKVLPRFELGSLDSKSRVLTITP